MSVAPSALSLKESRSMCCESTWLDIDVLPAPAAAAAAAAAEAASNVSLEKLRMPVEEKDAIASECCC